MHLPFLAKIKGYQFFLWKDKVFNIECILDYNFQ